MATYTSDTKKDSSNELQNKCITIVTVLNSILVMIGLGVVGFGVFVNVGNNVLRSQLEFASDLINKHLHSVGPVNIDLSTFDLVELLQELSTPLIALGMYCSALAVCGTLAVKKRIVVLIVMYCVLHGLGLMLHAVAAFIIFAQRKLLDGLLKTSLLTGLQESYRGYNETNLMSLTWNVVMISLHCCGVSDYRDFEDASQWRRNLFQDGWWFKLKTPVTCCNMERNSPDDFACAVNPLAYTSNYKQGCYDAAWALFDSYRGFPLAAFIAFMILQFVLLVASIVLARQLRISRKAKKVTQEVEEPQIGDGYQLTSPDRNEEHNRIETVANISQNKEGGGDCYQTSNDRKKYRAITSVLNSLPFTSLGGYKDSDFVQQYLSGARRNSIGQELLSQFLSDQSRYNRMSYDFCFPQGRMPSFDLGAPQNRTPFEYGMMQGRIPSTEYGVSQGPLIVQLQQQPKQKADLKTITESPEEDFGECGLTYETSEPNIAEKKAENSKLWLKDIGRCKSEACLNSKKKNQNSSESVLSRRKTLPKLSESKIEAM